MLPPTSDTQSTPEAKAPARKRKPRTATKAKVVLTACPNEEVGCPYGDNIEECGNEVRRVCQAAATRAKVNRIESLSAAEHPHHDPHEQTSDHQQQHHDAHNPHDDYHDAQYRRQSDMNPNMSQNSNNNNAAGYTWTIKELIPFVASLLISAFVVFQVYGALSNKIISLEKDVDFIKTDMRREVDAMKANDRAVNDKLDNLVKSNEMLKIQITEIANVVVKK